MACGHAPSMTGNGDHAADTSTIVFLRSVVIIHRSWIMSSRDITTCDVLLGLRCDVLSEFNA